MIVSTGYALVTLHILKRPYDYANSLRFNSKYGKDKCVLLLISRLA